MTQNLPVLGNKMRMQKTIMMSEHGLVVARKEGYQ